VADSSNIAPVVAWLAALSSGSSLAVIQSRHMRHHYVPRLERSPVKISCRRE